MDITSLIFKDIINKKRKKETTNYYRQSLDTANLDARPLHGEAT